MSQFTPEERELLKKYVTDPDGSIFAIKNLPGIVGAAFARYSRALGSFKETLLKEFLKEGVIDPEHAEQLIERILVAYGDDSVGELEGANVSFEAISNLAAKVIEDKRIGGSPIEQSSRYVYYDQKGPVPRSSKSEEGWKYLRPKEIMESQYAQEYEESMDRIFEIYHTLIEPVTNYYEQRKPLSEAEYDILGTGTKQKYSELTDEKDMKAFKRTYQFDLKTKTCDTIRVILPVATLTNVGMFGNGRYFQELISHLLTQEIAEMQDIGGKCLAELKKIIGPYVKRAKRNEWLSERRNLMRALSKELFHEQSEQASDMSVHLLPNEEYFVMTLAQMLYPSTELSLSKIIDKIKKMPEEERYEILETYVGGRKHRRHRPDRGLEAGYPLVFDITMDFGSYRDLQRHRMFTQQRQLITPHIGFLTPSDLIEAGVMPLIEEARTLSEILYKKIRQELGPQVAQYVVLFGHQIRWSIGCNLRAAQHMIELRTTPQGHPNYRKVCQLMASAIVERFPWTKEIFKFTDFEQYTWARGDSEARQRIKERELDKKYCLS